jgi:hypothetical protein
MAQTTMSRMTAAVTTTSVLLLRIGPSVPVGPGKQQIMWGLPDCVPEALTEAR